MKALKKGIVALMTIAMLGTSAVAEAQPNYTSGYGYSEATRAPTLGPALALGTIVLVAVIAILLNNSSSHQHNTTSS